MTFFVSTVTSRVDAKGRVSVPASFRSGLSGDAAAIYVFPSFRYPCLEGADLAYMQALSESADLGVNQFFVDQDDRVAAVMERAQALSFDPVEGRVVMPKPLLDHAGIGSEILFAGQGKTFQIWSPALYETHKAERAARALEQARRFAATKGEGA